MKNFFTWIFIHFPQQKKKTFTIFLLFSYIYSFNIHIHAHKNTADWKYIQNLIFPKLISTGYWKFCQFSDWKNRPITTWKPLTSTAAIRLNEDRLIVRRIPPVYMKDFQSAPPNMRRQHSSLPHNAFSHGLCSVNPVPFGR